MAPILWLIRIHLKSRDFTELCAHSLRRCRHDLRLASPTAPSANYTARELLPWTFCGRPEDRAGGNNSILICPWPHEVSITSLANSIPDPDPDPDPDLAEHVKRVRKEAFK
ncbi:hypothetical protein JCM7686_1276 [Paracoccus aminophilus JCM 7686]|uniref:Uncharacterized protein n=1 Tax=Paracoccus aminophilus JCM 7686 TaxID=1367847 RepID=S5XT87_PARAH|nr:hypothetical protein JCM7686_1276 [Paracoccus aminophilus JCM 7686]